jgi:septum formation protein
MTRVVLASASPRRHDLLITIGVQFTVREPDIDESPLDGEEPVAYVTRLASAKAAAVNGEHDDLVIAADTTVDVDSQILGKPADDLEAAAMLRLLSGRTHRVHTGVSLSRNGVAVVEACTTLVTFSDLDEPTIQWYISTGEPVGKAGAYALQGAGAVLVTRVEGSVSNVIGLPMHLVVQLASQCGVALLESKRQD